ncbi:hypothetical protein CU097_005477 [Rhizopus azygosporus]|uniref:Uncharacterized protein n=1 Tax=Rhizopus azygosporus TaxID=86630 RepID=A0A367JGN1_RHIAZ|nr:hypothetical protein CU097_005477 [Rhizopus azygosporus]
MTAKEAADVAPAEPVAIGVAEAVTEDLEMEKDDISYNQNSNVPPACVLRKKQHEAASARNTQALQKVEVEMMESTTLAFIMEVRATESITQYSARFVKAINNMNMDVHNGFWR